MIRYRSRHNAGRPNWARITYAGKEETIFKRQKNLLCNVFHWIDNPERQWPDHFSACNGVRVWLRAHSRCMCGSASQRASRAYT